MNELSLTNLVYSKRTWIHLFLIVILWISFYNYIIKNDDNICEMTFMYQFPQFIVSWRLF